MDWCKLGILLGFSLARRRRCSGWSTRPFFVWNGEERLTALVVAAGVQFTGEEGQPLDTIACNACLIKLTLPSSYRSHPAAVLVAAGVSGRR